MRRIEQELTDPDIAAEAKSVLRSMIKTIVVFPGDGRGEVTLELHGELAAILAVAQGAKNKAGNPVSRIQVSVVAGARNHLDLQLQGLLVASFGLGGAEGNSMAAAVDAPIAWQAADA